MKNTKFTNTYTTYKGEKVGGFLSEPSVFDMSDVPYVEFDIHSADWYNWRYKLLTRAIKLWLAFAHTVERWSGKVWIAVARLRRGL